MTIQSLSFAMFRAWVDLVAEAGSKAQRRTAAVCAVGALTLSLGACGGPGAGSSSEPVTAEQTTSVSADPSEAVTAEVEAAAWKVKNVVVVQAAVDLYGKEAAGEGAVMAERLARDYSFNDQSTKFASGQGIAESKRWMLGIRKDMLPGAAADWSKSVNSYFAVKDKDFDSDNAHWGDIMSLTSYGLYDKGMFPAEGTPVMEDPTIKSINVDVEADGRLWVTMKTQATYNFVSGGIAKQSVATRDQEMWLEKVDGQWMIDGWHGTCVIKVVA